MSRRWRLGMLLTTQGSGAGQKRMADGCGVGMGRQIWVQGDGFGLVLGGRRAESGFQDGDRMFCFRFTALKALLIFCSLIVGAPLYATPPEYYSSRKWVEERCTTNDTPKSEHLFLGRVVPQEYAAIVQYHRGISLREIIDQTQFKGTTVNICVLRPHVNSSTNVIHVKGPCKNKFGVYGAEILVVGEARATRIPRQWVCKERATKPAAKRSSQKCRSYFCTVPKPADTPKFEVKPLDMIWIYKGGPVAW
jgi:hypothetical protein